MRLVDILKEIECVNGVVDVTYIPEGVDYYNNVYRAAKIRILTSFIDRHNDMIEFNLRFIKGEEADEFYFTDEGETGSDCILCRKGIQETREQFEEKIKGLPYVEMSGGMITSTFFKTYEEFQVIFPSYIQALILCSNL